MGKDIKTKAANEVKTLEAVGELGKRMKQAYIRAKQRKVGDTSGTSPPPLGEGSAANQAGPENFSQPGNICIYPRQRHGGGRCESTLPTHGVW